MDENLSSADAINEDLEKLNQWANRWQVDFSPPKTKELVISRKRDPPIHPQLYLDGAPIVRVDSHKHLGLTVSEDLTWKVHIQEMVDKANSRLGILRSLKYKLDRLSLEKIYTGLIRPLLEYGDVIWDSPGDALDALEKVQLNAARIVIGATARCSTEGLYKETGWEPLSSRRTHHRLTLMYKIINGKAPGYLIDLVPNLVQDRTGYNLRNRGDIDVPPARINVFSNSFFPSTIRLWNELDIRIKNLPSVDAFKAHHKRSLPRKNALYYFGGRLESAIHARMRINNSPLNADLHNFLHVIESPLCHCGLGVQENADHFFFKCPLYVESRNELVQDLQPLTVKNVEHLLFGIPNRDHPTNLHVFTAVHKYIRATKRFY